MELVKDIVYGTENPGKQILDLYLPDGNTSDVLIYFHGGGLESGDKSTDLPDNFGLRILAKLWYPRITACTRMLFFLILLKIPLLQFSEIPPSLW